MFKKKSQNYALGSVVREINSLLPLFDAITWIGFDKPEHKGDASFGPVSSPKIRLVFLGKCGGDRLSDKLGVLLRSPQMAARILWEMLRHEVIYTRAPSSPAFIATLLSFFFLKKTFWHKYAGNWAQSPAPRFFALQRAVLQRSYSSKVTINGRWPNQPSHCLSFENPCLELAEQIRGRQVLSTKTYSSPLRFCFVGRLEEAKGVHWILDAFKILDADDRVGSLHLVGDGPLRVQCEQLATASKIPIHVHGFLGQAQVADIMAQSHILLLPSAAEGFPKVVAEAANVGCIPIVTDVSCIGQYIRHEENGFLLQTELLPKGQLAGIIVSLPDADALKTMAERVHALCSKFTYEHFVERVKNEILSQRKDPLC